MSKKRGRKQSAAPMDPKRFWDLIAATKRPSEDEQNDALRDELLKLSPEEVLGFALRYEHLVDAAYRVDLWGAAYTINGGCSDDGFHYFRCWLVDQGQKVYDAALKNPDSLADVVNPDEEYESSGLDHAAQEAWLAQTGKSEDDFYAELDRARKRGSGQDLQGEDWDFDDDDEVRRRFPRLAAIYCGPGGEEDE
jgi:hypothetical protein